MQIKRRQRNTDEKCILGDRVTETAALETKA